MSRKIRIAIPTNYAYMNYINAVLHTAETLSLDAEAVRIGFDEGKSGAAFLDPSEYKEEDFDALLLPGGDDIDPSYYGEENTACHDIDKKLDELQFSMLNDFVKAKKPVLGICRGHQVIDVFFGGSMIQNVEHTETHVWLEDDDNVHEIRAEEGSILYRLYGERFSVNSAHHQAAKKIGDGLKVTAYAADGIVEAFEHESLPVFSFQFHPERMSYEKRRTDTVDGSPIFVYFLKLAKESADRDGRF